MVPCCRRHRDSRTAELRYSRGSIILAGGESNRIGVIKPFITFRKKPLITHIINTISTLVSETIIVISEGMNATSTFTLMQQILTMNFSQEYIMIRNLLCFNLDKSLFYFFHFKYLRYPSSLVMLLFFLLESR